MVDFSDQVDIYVPDGSATNKAVARTTHLAIAAHQDDIELLAMHGILACFQQPQAWFSGVVITDGAGSPRSGAYAHYSDTQMRAIRRQEQRKAAMLGEYGLQLQYGMSSPSIKGGVNQDLVQQLKNLLLNAQPDVLYTHNPFDSHATHVAVCHHVMEALGQLEPGQWPKKIYGCEVWRSLDWLPDCRKVSLPVADSGISQALLGVFDSQLNGGKRYDVAIQARRRSHATFSDARTIDTNEGMTYAIELSPCLANSTTLQQFMQQTLDEFQQQVFQTYQSIR